MQLENKCYLITGASSGLGFEIVKQLLRIKGTKIIAVARNIKSIEGLYSNNIIALSFDVSNPENIDKMIETAIEKMGRIDCLIACAGFGYYEKFENKDYYHIEKIFKTNVLSPLYTLQKILNKTKGKVSFTIISSAIGKFGLPGMVLYCTTKFALDGFADAYRFEKPKRLHYMTVYPIGLSTDFWNRIGSNFPLPKPLQPANEAAKFILCGICGEKRFIGSFPMASAIWLTNRFFPVFIPLYQMWNKIRFDKWQNGFYNNI